jgi:hypothetical protein
VLKQDVQYKCFQSGFLFKHLYILFIYIYKNKTLYCTSNNNETLIKNHSKKKNYLFHHNNFSDLDFDDNNE